MKHTQAALSRRSFLLQSAAATASVASASAFAELPGGHRKVMHIIGHSHIDAAWLWPWRDGADTVLNTFRSALNRMRENPSFCYSHSSSMHYRWAQRADPKLFAEVLQRIREGRWEVVGAWPVEPDCNIPAAESFVRHSLYGKRFCQQALGVDVKIAFNPDSFGHAAGLPSILRHAGYEAYVFMRPQEHEMETPVLFWWQGPDGSRLLTLRIWDGYDSRADLIPKAAAHVFAPGMEHGAFFLGVGDHGGAVTAEEVRRVSALQSDPALPELRWSTLQQFFAAARIDPAFANLPVITGDLQHHARGCYSAFGEGKYLNRRVERSLVASETIAVVSGLSANHPFPPEGFAEAWWKLLFCQFHDLLAGTALYADYQDLRDTVGYAGEVALSTRIEALETLAKRVDLSAVPESAVFAFNPLPWPRSALLEFHIQPDPEHHGRITHLQPPSGSPVPLQFRPADSMTVNSMPRLSAWVDLPACGYTVFDLAHGDPPEPRPFLNRIHVSETGFGLSSLQAEDGTELLSAPVSLIALADSSDTWAHDVRQFRQEMGRPSLLFAGVVENGPVTRVTRHRATWRNSEILLDIAEFAGIDAVELRFVIDWREHQQILKLEVPTAFPHPRLFAKVPGAILERQTNGEEEPYQDWAAVQGRIGAADYTVGILNAGSYSYDCLNGLFRTALIRSAPFAQHQPNPAIYFDANAWQDQGRQERRFWLVAGKGPFTALSLDRRAEELQTPAEYVVDSAHEGSEPRERSFLEVLPASVWVLALKQAEDGSGDTILRLQERSGKSSTAAIKSSLLHLDISVPLHPWQLKTLRIRRSATGPAVVQEVSLLEI